jgi:TatD DNase family protein
MGEEPRDVAAPGGELVDIGANLMDPMFQGIYRDKQRHQSDLDAILTRAQDAGVSEIVVTAGSLAEAREALDLCSAGRAGPRLRCTVGVHPTRCGEFDSAAGSPSAHLEELVAIGREGVARGACVAVGELGLDYDRCMFCPKEQQLKYFELQLTGLAAPLGLPLFLHCRTSEAAGDLRRVLETHRALLPKLPGVVHSFDGSLEDARSFIDLGFFIGINGCSLRTPENLDVVKGLPLSSLLLETDAPWCSIKASHAGHKFVSTRLDEVKKPEKWEEGKCVKDRNEPCHLRQVLEVVAGAREEDPQVLAALVLENTRRFLSACS